MGRCRGEVPPASEALKALPEPERAGRQRLLEPPATARRQRLTLPGTHGGLEISANRSPAASAATAILVTRPPIVTNPLDGPTLLSKPRNGPTSLTKSELNCHRTELRVALFTRLTAFVGEFRPPWEPGINDHCSWVLTALGGSRSGHHRRAQCAQTGRYEVAAGLRAMKTSSRPGRSGAPRTSVSSKPAEMSESSITERGG